MIATLVMILHHYNCFIVHHNPSCDGCAHDVEKRTGFPRIFKNPFSILFQELFNTKLEDFNTIILLHFSKILLM